MFFLKFIYYYADSVNFCLVVSADCKLLCWDCGFFVFFFYNDGNSSLCSAFSIMPEHLIASHGKALVIFQVSVMKADHIDVFFVEFLCKGYLLKHPFCIPL